jgi:hypothetical protein
MYFLEHKEPYAMPNILGNHSFPVHTYRWRTIAVSEEKYALENLIPTDKRSEYRVICNEHEKECEGK